MELLGKKLFVKRDRLEFKEYLGKIKKEIKLKKEIAFVINNKSDIT